MTDPFEALRELVAPLAPRPEFARELRRRIVAELGPTGEAPMPVLAIREYTPARSAFTDALSRNERSARAPSLGTPTCSTRCSRRSDHHARRPNRHAEIALGTRSSCSPGSSPRRAPEPGYARRSSVGLMLHVPDSGKPRYARAIEMGRDRAATDSGS